MTRLRWLSPRGTGTWFCVLAITFLFALWISTGTPPASRALHLGSLHLPAGSLILQILALTALLLFLWISFPRHASGGRAIFLIFLASVTIRIAWIPYPVSSDVYRYIWEGRVLREGYNPYLLAPTHSALAEIAQNSPEHPQINHPDLPAIYPPLALQFFAGWGRISASPAAAKFLVLFFDVATIAILLLILHDRRLPLQNVLLYALHPLVLLSFAGEAHLDALMVFFCSAAFLASARKAPILMWLFIGCAVQSKMIAVVLIPFFINRSTLRRIPLLLVPLLIPYLFVPERIAAPFAGSLLHFGTDFSFNAPLHMLLAATGLPVKGLPLRLALLFAFLFGCSIYRHFQRIRHRLHIDPEREAFWIFGALLLLLPTVHFWYLTWVIPLLALRPNGPWLLLSLCASFSLVANGIAHETGVWSLPLWASVAQWLPFGLLLLLQAPRQLRLCARPHDPSAPPRTTSILIPTLNEVENLERAIHALRQDPAVGEIIVADGGSSDGTPALAETLGCRLVHAPDRGRGGQLAAALACATGDIAILVHADTRIHPPWISRVREVLLHNPNIVGGSIGSHFDRQTLFLRLVETANNLRAALGGIAFGDQIQFFRTAPFRDSNLFPALPLMEDVELSLRLATLGDRIHLHGDAVVSARRWARAPFAHAALVLSIVSTYLIARCFHIDTSPQARRVYYPPKRP